MNVLMSKKTTPTACTDCVDVHGDLPEEWLAKWPAGAEWSKDYGVHLCDGCCDERYDNANALELSCYDLDGEVWDY